MRKALVLPLVAAVLALSAGWATAAPDDAKGPACANIIDTDFSYSADGETATVIIFLDTASCTGITYTLVVQDSATETAIQATGTAPGDDEADDTSGLGTDSVTVNATVPVSDRDSEVCLYATTSKGGRNVFDRAPDATLSPNCVTRTPGGGAGGTGFG